MNAAWPSQAPQYTALYCTDRLDAGLFFLAYQRDPGAQFVRIQTSLAGNANDALNEYIQHVGSGLFACPPGLRAGEYWGQALFA